MKLLKSTSMHDLAQSVATIMIALVFFGTSTIQALSQDDIDAINRDSVHYKLGGSSTSVCDTDNLPSLPGSSRPAQAFNYLVDRGLSDAQAAGVVGNLKAESGVMPNRKQGSGIQTITSYEQIAAGTGYGIAQWTTGDRQLAWIKAGIADAGLAVKADLGDYDEEEKRIISSSVLSLGLQLQYLFSELETNPGYGLAELQAAQDVSQATWIFLAFFERPGVVVDAGLAGNPNMPESGPAREELDRRISLAVTVNGGESGGCTPRGPLTGGTETPDFKANPAVAVDESPPGEHKESNCTGKFTVGAASLKQLVEETWIPPVTSVGGYACRSIFGGSETSIHGMGRAIDIMISAETAVGLQTGDEIRNFMINNSTNLGVQRVIWNGYTWSSDKDGWRVYTGESPHTDHLHVEINLEASKDANLAGGGL
jgi:hypothetical protein